MNEHTEHLERLAERIGQHVVTLRDSFGPDLPDYPRVALEALEDIALLVKLYA